MKIRYDFTIDDMVAFTQYYNNNSSTIKKIKYSFLIIVPFVVIGLTLLIKPTVENTRLKMVLIAVVYSILFSLFVLYIFRTSSARLVPRLLKEGTNKGLIGWHELEFNKNGLIERTEVNETQHTWLGISKIVETETHAFIFITSIMAHVVPKKSVSTGDADQFIALLKQHWHAANPDKELNN